MTASAPEQPVSPLMTDEPLVGSYFIAVYPPFSCWQAATLPAVEEALSEHAVFSPLGLYVHIPFCQKKCDYCHYLSYVGAHPGVIDRYLDSVVSELGAYVQWPAIKGRPVCFVYIGGGTPSVLTTTQVRRLASGLQYFLPWKGIEEVAFECAPRSVNRELLECLREIGVTRLSMGAQSLDNTVLRLNGRVHLAEDVLGAYKLIRETGFDCVNLDLMTGLIGETQKNWADTIRRIIELAPDSVTIYQTEIAQNTKLYEDLEQGHLPMPPVSWETKRARLDYGFGKLTKAGYSVVSGYTAVKDPARRRFRYQDHLWRGGDMLGLGVASFSYLDGVHFQNAVTLETYTVEVRQGNLPLKRAYRLRPIDQLVREFILQLKWGEVSVSEFRNKFSGDLLTIFAPQLNELAAAGLLTYSSSAVRLTREGVLRVDRLLPLFYAPEFRNAE